MPLPVAPSVRCLSVVMLVCGLLACGEGGPEAPVAQHEPEREQRPAPPPAAAEDSSPATEPGPIAEPETASVPIDEATPEAESAAAPEAAPVRSPDPLAVQPTARLSDTPGGPPAAVNEEQTEETAPTNLTPDPSLDPQPVPSTTLDTSRLIGVGGGAAGGPLGNPPGESPMPLQVFRLNLRAQRVAFVVDASGPMQELLPRVRAELAREIERMNGHNQFTLIVFSGEGVYEVPGGGKRSGLRAATADFKQAATQWLDAEQASFPVGGNASAHALAAIQHALKHEPEVVYVISATLGDADQNATAYEAYREALVQAIARDNARLGTPAKIYTAQLVQRDPAELAGLAGTLRQIAEQSGGSHRFLDQRLLERR